MWLNGNACKTYNGNIRVHINMGIKKKCLFFSYKDGHKYKYYYKSSTNNGLQKKYKTTKIN